MLREEVELVRQIVKEEIAAALKFAKVAVKVETPKPVEAEVKAGSFTKKEIDTNRYTNN